jgi:hypothetical protein
VLTGGAYNDSATSFTRSKSGQKLYTVTIDKTDTNAPVYTLNFKDPGSLAKAMMRMTSNDEIIKEYYKNFVLAFSVTGDADRKKIRSIIAELFKDGVRGAEKRQLVIKDGPNASVTLTLSGENVTITDNPITVTKAMPTFNRYLALLENDVMPVPPITT